MEKLWRCVCPRRRSRRYGEGSAWLQARQRPRVGVSIAPGTGRRTSRAALRMWVPAGMVALCGSTKWGVAGEQMRGLWVVVLKCHRGGDFEESSVRARL